VILGLHSIDFEFPAFWYGTTYGLTASYQLFWEFYSLQLQDIPEGSNFNRFSW
jgi:hypothetical protein